MENITYKISYQSVFSNDVKEEIFENFIYAEWYFEDIKDSKLIRNVKLEKIELTHRSA